MNTGTLVSSHPVSVIWQKASVVGGLWASIEIIAGSFLHNLRVPFSGTILAFFGIILLIAFSRLWPDRGLIWRAGLICALMKSISPSAVILGPMTGIFAEALLLQLMVFTFGRNHFGYLAGSILGLMSALFHKVISLLILYGFDLFKIYLNLYLYAAKQVRIEDANPWVLVLILLIVYIVLGIIAAIIGMNISKQRSPKNPENHKQASVPFDSGLNPPANTPIVRYSLIALFIHLAVLPVCLFMVNKSGLHLGLIIPGSYCLLILFTYTRHLRRFKKPFFWIQVVIVMVMAVLFWGDWGDPAFPSRWQGLWIGLQLNFRAVVVILGFTAISIELKNPLIQRFLVNHGFKNIYLSLSLAFSILPFMLRSIANGRSFFTHPLNTLSAAFSQADEWLAYLQNDQEKERNL